MNKSVVFIPFLKDYNLEELSPLTFDNNFPLKHGDIIHINDDIGIMYNPPSKYWKNTDIIYFSKELSEYECKIFTLEDVIFNSNVIYRRNYSNYFRSKPKDIYKKCANYIGHSGIKQENIEKLIEHCIFGKTFEYIKIGGVLVGSIITGILVGNLAVCYLKYKK